MKKLSLKMKLTLLYTILMTALVAGIFVCFFHWAAVRFSLRRRAVFGARCMRPCLKWIMMTVCWNSIRILDDMENGVYLSVYESDGMFCFWKDTGRF